MSMRTVSIIAIALGLGIVPAAAGGYYNTIDTLEETSRYSRDYAVFLGVLTNLRAIPAPKVERDIPIRRRYMLMEALAHGGNPKLGTLEQQLNYSAVLIRRNRADEAMVYLLPLTKEHPRNFVVISQYATARFLSNNADFTSEAPEFMKQALELWPQRWTDLEEDQKKFLESIGWEETALERYRRYEVYFERLMRNRVREERKRRKKLEFEDAVDPIFLDAKDKPIRFLSEGGIFEPGRILAADKEKMPEDSIEAVEQLLIWMPNDQRLLWLLGEVFNASAMKHKDDKSKNQVILSAYSIFTNLTDPRTASTYGAKDIKARYQALNEYVASIPQEQIKIPEEQEKDSLWWRIGVGFLAGFFVGMIALWQLQEVRRRRQARAAQT